jgi:hypothetical protein
MKRNTWVFYFFIILFTTILSINLVWRFTPIRAEISSTVQKRLRQYLGDSFALNDFSVGFGYMSFTDISVGNPGDRYILKLEEIQIGYSIHKLVYNSFDPLRVIESVTFKDPKLLFIIEKKDSAETKSSNKISLSDILRGFRKLAEIDRILVEKGQVHWGKTHESTTKLISELNGFLVIRSIDSISLRLQGKLFESESPDLHLNGDIHLSDENLDIIADIQSSHIKESIPFLNGKSFALKEADASGKVQIHSESFLVNDLKLSGDILVENMQGLLFNQQLSANTFSIKFQNHQMLLSPVTGIVEDGRFTLNGNLGSIFQPELNFSIRCENFSAKNLKSSVPILELLDKGEIQAAIDIAGPPSKVFIAGEIYSSKLYYAIVPFSRAILNFEYKNKLWEFKNIETYSAGMQHRGSGEIDFNSMKLKLKISSLRQIGASDIPIFDRLNSTEMKYFTTVDGDFPTLTFLGNIHGRFETDSAIILSADAQFELIEDQISFQNYNSYPKGLQISSKILDLWNNPTFQILEVKNIPMDSLSTIAAMSWIDDNFQGDFFLSGPVNFPTTKFNLSNRSTQESVFSFSGNAIKLIETDRKFKGNFSLQSIPKTIDGELSLESKDNQISLSLNVSDIAQGTLTLGYGEYASLLGQLEMVKVPIDNYLGRLPQASEAIEEGYLYGDLKFYGKTNFPKIDFNLQGQDFIINKNGYYSANIRGSYSPDSLKFSKALIAYNNHPIIDASLTMDIFKDHLNASFSGEGIESNFIASTIFRDSTLIQGDMNYQLFVEGPLQRPFIRGSVYMQEGILQNRPFSRLNITFQDSIPASAKLSQIDQHYIKINNFEYKDKRGYSVGVSGTLPTNRTFPMELKLEAEGNILAELPAFIPFFQNPVCLGELSLDISGTRENPKIDAGQLSIYNGSLEFSSVIPPLKDIKADIELGSGSQFLQIKHVEGKINNENVRIYNLDSVKVQDNYLDSWNFEDIGINFGILVLETDKRGIPLSIPGLMNPGDIGYFSVEGKEKSEAFYFYGPVERPQVRGKVILTDSRVTFPFLVEEGEAVDLEEDKVMEFLMNINWDVAAIAGIGNRYFVDIPAIIGEVYLDLNIDNVSEGLDFTGRLSDETFKVGGSVESTRGRVEYLDMNFRVDRFGINFNKFELLPEVYGRAWTTTRDSTDFPRDVYLVLYTIDPETQQEVPRGRWEDFRFKLISSDPTIGETQENVLAYLGYSVDNISSKAGDIGATLTDNLLIRPLVRPLERKMERGLRLDYVRVSLQITSNLLYFGLQPRWKFLPESSYLRSGYINTFDPALLLLQSSQITIGKYVMNDFYFTYSGQLVSIYDEPKLGLNHRFGVEYRLLQNLLLEFEYDRFLFEPTFYYNYDQSRFQDFRIRLKHSFNF